MAHPTNSLGTYLFSLIPNKTPPDYCLFYNHPTVYLADLSIIFTHCISLSHVNWSLPLPLFTQPNFLTLDHVH